jgi:hypothetical protein
MGWYMLPSNIFSGECFGVNELNPVVSICSSCTVMKVGCTVFGLAHCVRVYWQRWVMVQICNQVGSTYVGPAGSIGMLQISSMSRCQV